MKCSHNLVAIHWIDAETTHGAWSKHKRKKPEVMITVAYEVDRDEYFIYHASTHCEKNLWGDLGKIPLGMVLEVEVLKDNFPCRGIHKNEKAIASDGTSDSGSRPRTRASARCSQV